MNKYLPPRYDEDPRPGEFIVLAVFVFIVYALLFALDDCASCHLARSS